MAKRSKARQRALEILFEAEQRGINPLQVLTTRVEKADMVVNEYVRTLIDGVTEHREEIDELLATYARGWTLDRMPPVDLMALRIGTWELLHNEEIPDSVAVSEAVTLVRKLSTDESPGFVNGVLGRLQKLKPTLG
ncbi:MULTISPECIES: transcription antitermination factor NusB [Nesterenkonia]|uniref:Transcription antitermination protein NusB n=1 Tax=Nesterenkonia salmonea TaxID=1804987 RepID=A0A5R9BF55_9MICC|nr:MULTISPECIES: transcription antitermination factor NusB [Nesterenkonia]NDK30659.1 transcription antitermination factor NusB [Nesterenkonia haasae]TLP99114.1 transcription antitermination factor NusB [Nesterenkonia salmonea]